MKKKKEKLMKIDCKIITAYGDDDKYIKTKIKTYRDSNIIIKKYNSIIKKVSKNTRRKNTTKIIVNNNSRFYPLCI